MTARREWHAAGVSWRVIPHSGGLVATWESGGCYVSRTFYGYTRQDAARLVAETRRRDVGRVLQYTVAVKQR
jgi:hypothetical protein